MCYASRHQKFCGSGSVRVGLCEIAPNLTSRENRVLASHVSRLVLFHDICISPSVRPHRIIYNEDTVCFTHYQTICSFDAGISRHSISRFRRLIARAIFSLCNCSLASFTNELHPKQLPCFSRHHVKSLECILV